MCGIAGELRWDGRAPDLRALAAMGQKMQRRGPDDDGLWQRGAVALCHRRLATSDLSNHAHQPMRDATLGLTLVFNGFIYNYKELRAELQAIGHTFFSDGDSEVLLKAFAAWGEQAVLRLNGMFAFALWDENRQQLLLGRDRFGVKPLYLARQEGGLRFASTLPALVAGGGVSLDLDVAALHLYLSFHGTVPGEQTLLKSVRKLPAATLRTIGADGSSRDWCYWQPPVENREVSQEESRDEGRRLLAQAVQRRLTADVPVGVLLSGGLDSSLIARLANSAGGKVATFSIGFEASAQEAGDEFEYSDIVASQLGTPHQRWRISNDELLANLNDAIGAMSEPMVSQDNIGFYLLARNVRQHVVAALSGQGADELFAGYRWHRAICGDGAGSLADRYGRYALDRSADELNALLTSPFRLNDSPARALLEQRLNHQPGSELSRLCRFDATVLMPDDPLKRVDNMTMAFALECRTPFLDPDLAQWALSLPDDLRLHNGEGKWQLKQMAVGLVDERVIWRPKGYFPVPPLKVLPEPLLATLRRALTSPDARTAELWQPAWLTNLLSAPNSHFTRLNDNVLWQIGVLELWLRQLAGEPLPC